jgi:ubiquinone/menaquinone biosynthesis C-methylase UbiE
VEQHDAIALIRPGVPQTGATWADLGAGSGVFSRALAALIGPAGTVYAVDRDARALRDLGRSATRGQGSAEIRTMVGDFMQPLDLPPLDGVLLANALHYVPYPDQPRVMRDVARYLVPGATMIVVEYDRRGPNRWVPYPISFAALANLARDAGLGAPVRLGAQPSQYGGDLYAASLGTSRAAQD